MWKHLLFSTVPPLTLPSVWFSTAIYVCYCCAVTLWWWIIPCSCSSVCSVVVNNCVCVKWCALMALWACISLLVCLIKHVCIPFICSEHYWCGGVLVFCVCVWHVAASMAGQNATVACVCVCVQFVLCSVVQRVLVNISCCSSITHLHFTPLSSACLKKKKKRWWQETRFPNRKPRAHCCNKKASQPNYSYLLYGVLKFSYENIHNKAQENLGTEKEAD